MPLEAMLYEKCALECQNATQSGEPHRGEELSLPEGIAYAQLASHIHTRANAHEVDCWTSVLLKLSILRLGGQGL